MEIKILEKVGWGYSKLAVVVGTALQNLNSQAELHIIGDEREFPKYNVSKTPALIIDGEIIFQGKIPSLFKIIEILKVHI